MSYQFVAASNQFLEVNSALGITDFPVTISLAVKLSSDTDMGLVWLGSRLATNVWAGTIAVDAAANIFYAQSRNTGTTAFAPSTTDPATRVGVWTHIAGRFTNATARTIWVNGANEGSNTVNQTAGTINRISIGHFGDSSPALPADAHIAYVAVWNAAIADADITAVHSGTSPRDIANLVELWDFSVPSLVGLVGGTTLTQTGSPAFTNDNPNLPWLSGVRSRRRASLAFIAAAAARKKPPRDEHLRRLMKRI